MIQLPETFMEKMKGLLGEESDAFFKSYEDDRAFGAKDQSHKGRPSGIFQEFPFSIRAGSPGHQKVFIIRPVNGRGKHAYHEAGVYYIQEPSAMAVTALLDPKRGRKNTGFVCGARRKNDSHCRKIERRRVPFKQRD